MPYRVENIVRKGKIACNKQFLLFSQCFPQLYICSASRCDIVWQWVKKAESLFVYLQELASAKGNILENKELLDSLNKTKASSITIADSLAESVRPQASLDQVNHLAIQLVVDQ